MVLYYFLVTDWAVTGEPVIVMAYESGVSFTPLFERDRKLLKFCERNGVLRQFSRVVCDTNPNPPKDMLAYFTRFLVEKQFMPVAWHVKAKFDDKFKGKTRFYRGLGVIMVLVGHRVACFLKGDSQLVHADQRPSVQRPPMPAVRTKQVSTAFVPCGANIFSAALRSQLPPRGRETPDARLSSTRRPSR